MHMLKYYEWFMVFGLVARALRCGCECVLRWLLGCYYAMVMVV